METKLDRHTLTSVFWLESTKAALGKIRLCLNCLNYVKDISEVGNVLSTDNYDSNVSHTAKI